VKYLKDSTLIELTIVGALAMIGGFTLNFFIIFLGAGISFVIAGIMARKVEVVAPSKTSYDQMGSGLVGFFVVAVVYIVGLGIGIAIAQM
jgi:hypothetical protein